MNLQYFIKTTAACFFLSTVQLHAQSIKGKLAYTDILHTAPWKGYNTYAGIVTRVWGEWESQQFRASLTWRFGNKQMKSIKQRSTGSEQEQKRIGGDN